MDWEAIFVLCRSKTSTRMLNNQTRTIQLTLTLIIKKLHLLKQSWNKTNYAGKWISIRCPLKSTSLERSTLSDNIQRFISSNVQRIMKLPVNPIKVTMTWYVTIPTPTRTTFWICDSVSGWVVAVTDNVFRKLSKVVITFPILETVVSHHLPLIISHLYDTLLTKVLITMRLNNMRKLVSGLMQIIQIKSYL